jgi:serine/threonine protein kinase/Tol biopolymer transport system component
MTLVPGARLGPYEIVASLGTGGMGEVYRARDSRLRRELAVKVLPSSVAGDTGFLARFQSEARAASALNHPNIVTIHDIGTADGLSYILMELIDGRTLRQLLDGGPPPLKKTLQIAAQVAEGLAAAHARGIVHRDLKPENLMISKDGVVKILDFGLAKTTPLYAGRAEATASYQAAATEPGSVMGTVGYMSPEQASGRSLDFHSDQFSFGTILYEMITGRRAWKRNSAAETLTAIIREEPQPSLEAGAPSTPTALRWLIARCLSKEPEDRYASTRDLARDLSTIRDHLSEISRTALASTSARKTGRAGRVLMSGVLAAAGLAAGLWLPPLLRRSEKPALPSWTQVGFRRGVVHSARFGPDGQTIAYSAAFDGDAPRIYSTRPAFTETRTLDLPPAKLLAISSNSELAFLRNPTFTTMLAQSGTLARAGLEAGAARDLFERVLAADWSPDGSQLAVARRIDGKTRLEYPIGRKLYESDQAIGDVRISPDGAWIAFFEREDTGVSLVVVRASDGFRRALSRGWFTAQGLAWTADGREIFFTPQKQVRDTSPPMLAVTLAGEQRDVFRGPGQLRLHDMARDGRLLIARWDVQVGLRSSSSSASRERELSTTDDSMLSDLSSDGRTILVYDRRSLFLRPTDGSPPVRLGEDTRGARLSPDGKWVLALPTKAPQYPLLVPVGAGDVRRVESHSQCEYVEWFPDGKRILCEIPNPNGPFRMFVIETDTGKSTETAIAADAAADFDEAGPVSPDGTLVAGIGRSGDAWVLPLSGGRPRRFPGQGVARLPVGWTADGRRIFVHLRGSIPGKMQELDLVTGRAEPWRDLGPEDPAGLTRIGPVRVAADGRAWAYTHIRVLSNLYVVEGLK